MINFQGSKKEKNKLELETKNQLEHIIKIWFRDQKKSKRPRPSALQASCFDPAKDHTGATQSGFPCLQQVGFAYDDENGLAVNAFYPTQYIFDRAYGNYLGLWHLGEFMAWEMGLKMARLNCFIGRPTLGTANKTPLRGLEKIVREILPEVDK